MCIKAKISHISRLAFSLKFSEKSIGLMNQTSETKAMTQMNTEQPESLVIRRVPKVLVIIV